MAHKWEDAISDNPLHMAAQKTIFLVDDDEDDLYLMGEAIADLKIDINIFYAFNGNELLGMLRTDIENA